MTKSLHRSWQSRVNRAKWARMEWNWPEYLLEEETQEATAYLQRRVRNGRPVIVGEDGPDIDAESVGRKREDNGSGG